MQRNARERDEIYETERDTLKSLVRQMSSEIEILKQKLADAYEDRRGGTASGDGGVSDDPSLNSAVTGDVTTRWH